MSHYCITGQDEQVNTTNLYMVCTSQCHAEHHSTIPLHPCTPAPVATCAMPWYPCPPCPACLASPQSPCLGPVPQDHLNATRVTSTHHHACDLQCCIHVGMGPSGYGIQWARGPELSPWAHQSPPLEPSAWAHGQAVHTRHPSDTRLKYITRHHRHEAILVMQPSPRHVNLPHPYMSIFLTLTAICRPRPLIFGIVGDCRSCWAPEDGTRNK